MNFGGRGAKGGKGGKGGVLTCGMGGVLYAVLSEYICSDQFARLRDIAISFAL